MDENKKQFQCLGDCLKCRAVGDRRVQWQYCSAQFTYNTMRMIEALQTSVNELKEKVEAMQGNEATIFNPIEIAQEGDGAKKDAPKEN